MITVSTPFIILVLVFQYPNNSFQSFMKSQKQKKPVTLIFVMHEDTNIPLIDSFLPLQFLEVVSTCGLPALPGRKRRQADNLIPESILRRAQELRGVFIYGEYSSHWTLL